jgi:hypothetical protein
LSARLVLAGALAWVLAGCAAITPGSQVVAAGAQALQAAPVCCGTLAGAKRVPLPMQPANTLVEATNQAFDFGGNKAFFVLYELPAYTKPYSILVTSLPQGSLQDVAIFVPRVATYDANFKVTRFFDEKTLRNRGNNLERTVFINPGNDNERYLAIYGSDLSASIERAYSMVTVTPVMAGPVMFNMYSGVDGRSVLRSSPVGRITLEVDGLQPAAK